MPVRAILDTDIGTDVDDCLALALLLTSPEVSLEGVTCVYGDVELRSRLVLKLLRLAGCGGVPVLLGAESTLVGLRTIHWGGHEGDGLLEPGDPAVPRGEHAAEFIVRMARKHPGQLTLLAIGPLTNVALGVHLEPALPSLLREVVIMGGAIRTGEPDIPVAEYNLRCDPEAAHVVLSSGLPIRLVPLDVTLRTRLTAEFPDRIRRRGTALHDAVARQLELYPPFAQRGYTHPHDPLAVAVAIFPDLVRTVRLHLDVDIDSRSAPGALLSAPASPGLQSNVNVALEVDVDRFERLLLERLGG
jgi:purine nucleosidase